MGVWEPGSRITKDDTVAVVQMVGWLWLLALQLELNLCG